MNPDFGEVWVYLSASPLTALTITLVAYLLGDWIYQKSGRMPVLNPVLIAVIVITIGLTSLESITGPTLKVRSLCIFYWDQQR